MDLELTPSLEYADRFYEIGEIWGGTMEFKAVRLDRYDLDSAKDQEVEKSQ